MLRESVFRTAEALAPAVTAALSLIGFLFLFIDIKNKTTVSARTAAFITAGVLLFCGVIWAPSLPESAAPSSETISGEQPEAGDPQEEPPEKADDGAQDTSSQEQDTQEQDTQEQNAQEHDAALEDSGAGSQTAQGGADAAPWQGTGGSGQAAAETEQPPVLVAQVTLDSETLDMTVGDTHPLMATVLYSDNSTGRAVLWSSSNPAVASVDAGGTVTALSAGTTRITAQASKHNVARSAVCEITVAEPLRPPSGYSIRLSKDHAVLGETFKVSVTPNETDPSTQILLHALSPSGQEESMILSGDGLYLIDTEVGLWTISASVTNAAGTYRAQKDSDYVTIRITGLDETLSGLLAGLM